MSDKYPTCCQCNWYLLWQDFYFYNYCPNPDCELEGAKQ